jgi:hypothetical protein
MKPIINVKIVEEMIIKLKMTKSNKNMKIISWAQKVKLIYIHNLIFYIGDFCIDKMNRIE